MAVNYDVEWIFVCGCFASWFFGWATGANDVANAFGTSVGSKALTMAQAVLLASVFNFIGAIVLGTVSTSTLQGGVSRIEAFQREPEIYAYGMLCALTVSGVWNALCSYWEMNASSTHSIIGSIIGFSLAYKGSNAVIWATPDPESKAFPIRGVVPIIVSWFISPVATGISAGLIFLVCRATILRAKNSFNRTFWSLPPLVLITVFACVYFVITKGAAKSLSEISDKYAGDGLYSFAAWVSAVCGGGCALLIAIFVPFFKKRSELNHARKEAEAEAARAGLDLEDVAIPWEQKSVGQKLKAMALHGVQQDIHKIVDEDPLVNAIHERAEKFDEKTENAFCYLQIFSAICVIFAHGANDSGYMIGPLNGIWQVYRTGNLVKKSSPPVWIVLIGASGLVVGLATYGYNITRAMGTRMAKLSPSRGFAAELATAITILLLSQYGLPNSTSQAITGAIVGVGLFGGLDYSKESGWSWDTSGVNWLFFAKTFTSWVSTLLVCGIGTAALFAQGVYAPSVPGNRAILAYEDGLNAMTKSIVREFNTSVVGINSSNVPIMYEDETTDYAVVWAKVNKSYNNMQKWYFTPSMGNGTVPPQTLLQFFGKDVLGLVSNFSLNTVGVSQIALNTTLDNSAKRWKLA